MPTPPTQPIEPSSRVLVVGAQGMLGTAWTRLLTKRGIPHDAVDRDEGDLTQAADVERLLTPSHTHVINAAAWTDVDGAEEREADATLINGAAVGLLADRCAAIGATLVHYSTDYVFDGFAQQPYPTEHPRDPINAYGRSKAAGEVALEASAAGWLALRTSWLYAPWGPNFVRTIARLAMDRDELQVVNDQRGRPTSAEHLAETTLRMLASGARGMHHGTDSGACTWFDFATLIAARINPACTVKPCGSEQYPRPAARPAYSVLDLSKTEALIGPMTPWQDTLASVLDRLPETQTAGDQSHG